MTETIEFIGFEPGSGLTDQTAEKLEQVMSESPSDANARAVLKKTQAGFEGRVQISSAAGTFTADVVDTDPTEVVDNLVRKLRAQLRAWKSRRWVS